MSLFSRLISLLPLVPLGLCAESAFLFTSFRGNGDGLHLSHSKDGRHWTDLDQVFLKPEVGSKLMRDIHVMQGPDGVFRMVWTTGWKDKGIGYGLYETTDWKSWTDVSSHCSAVEGQRHGTIFPVSADILTKIAPDAGATPPPPALPGLTADPHIAEFGGTYYLYPTTDGSEGWMSTSFRAWSSRDLKTWKDEGVILDLPRDLKWADVRAWAPAIATANKKFYYYYSAGQSVGVAVADKPTGPFKDPLGKPLVAKGQFKGVQSIDPMVFIDDDSSAYLYFGQGRCKAVKLNADMVSFDVTKVQDITPPGYNEGSFVFKRKGVYYLSWSEFDTRDPRYSVAYATSDSPLGPYKKAQENPILKQKGAVKGAGHHSIVKIPGRDEWVIAYHRFRIPGGNGYNRETCLSPMRFDEKGAILPVDVFEPLNATHP